MLPVARIATGFVVVFGALRLGSFDLLFDPVGWGMCMGGLTALRRSRDDPFNRAGICAVAMICVSCVTVVASLTSSSFATSPVNDLIGLVSAAGALITVWLAVDAVIGRIRATEDSSRAGLLDVLRWAVAGLGVVNTLAGHGYAALGAVTLIAWLAALVTLIVLLYRAARLPCLAPAWEPVAGL